MSSRELRPDRAPAMRSLARRVNFAGVCTLVAVLVTSHAASAVTLYGLVDAGDVYVSTDAGVSWNGETAVPARVAIGLVAGPALDERTLLTRDGAVWQTASGPWSPVGSIVANDLTDLTVAADGTLLALATTGTVYVSSDGVAWSAAAALPVSDAVSITVDRDGRRYVLTRTGTIWRDDGAGFAAVAALPLSDAVSIRARFNVLRAMSSTGWILGSDDDGTSWQTVGTLSQVGSVALTATASGWAAVTNAGDVATSLDGSAWTWNGSLSQIGVVGLASTWSLVTSVEPGPPGDGLALGAPYPNPAPSGSTFALPVRGLASNSAVLEVFDARGRRRARVTARPAGGELRWTNPGVDSGSYFLRITDTAGGRGTVRWVVVD